ncbi:transcriptional regulator [Bacillus cereus]|uniref:helix-turn-helix domain-containing protein n=2 Tax=Bacillus TaxID=1386 RepID=UPI000BFC4A29|nr:MULTISPECIES: helix-turn-helix transcriptional regulator [Bacillus cereus group]PGK19280.1 transcriptional regulator [Bacillus cereus]PGU92217.1 transcriptional regulator [Bacillus cereus]PGU98958.1 transcriptional regulator [Bacillus thuringiensis]
MRTVRESKGITVRDLSRATNIPENTLYCIEIGKDGVNASRAKDISLCLQEPLEKIFEPSVFSAKK